MAVPPTLLDIQGHRGARALWPENSLPGFLAAAKLGVTSLELDVVLTQDGIPVVFHDLHLNPDLVRHRTGLWLTPPGPLISTLRAQDLAGLDIGRLRPGSPAAARFPQQAALDGTAIPLLHEVLSLLRAHPVRLDIELKTHPGADASTPELAAIVDAVLAAIEAAAMAGQVSIRAFNWHVLRRVRAMRPDIPLAWLTATGPHANPEAVAAEAAQGGHPAWQPSWAPDHRGLRQAQVRAAHALGLAVKPWTVNVPARMAQLIAWGVDGLCTDRPDLARAETTRASNTSSDPLRNDRTSRTK